LSCVASLDWSRSLIFREVEDRDLIAKARRGHVEAYNVLVSRWEKRVFNYLLRLVGEREDALDLSQDVFLKAYQNLKKLDDPAKFAAWLFRIAHNEAYSLFRKRRPEGETEEIRPETLEGATTVGGNAVFPVELTLAVSSALARLSCAWTRRTAFPSGGTTSDHPTCGSAPRVSD